MKRCGISIFFVLFISFAFIIGCGSASDDLENSGASGIPTNTGVTLIGYVTDGSQTSIRTSSEMRFSLGGDLSGITVFLEKLSNLYGVTDATGKYTILNVPKGVHTLIAEKREVGGQITFRARQENVIVNPPTTGTNEVVELPKEDTNQVISMKASPYSLNFYITDNNNNPINNATVTLWGEQYISDASGSVRLKDFPSITDAEAIVSAQNYRSTRVLVSFGETFNSDMYVKLPLTTESNIAPIVSIKYDDNNYIRKINDVLYIEANKRQTFTANGNDPDGSDTGITYSWYATGGEFSGGTVNRNVTFIASESYSNAVITLVGKDGKGGEGKAELVLRIYNGKDPEPEPIATDTPDIATDTPDIATDTPDIATDTPDIATDTPDIATDTPDIATDTPDIASDTPQISEDVDYSNLLENTSKWTNVSGESMSLISVTEVPSVFDAMLSSNNFNGMLINGASSYTPNIAITIDFNEGTITPEVSEDVASLTEDLLTISATGIYVLKGDYNGHILIEEAIQDGVIIALKDAHIHSINYPAIINQNPETPLCVFIDDVNGEETENSLTSVASYTIKSSGDLTIAGSSKGILTASNTANLEACGIYSSGNNGIFIRGGIIDIITKNGDAIRSESYLGVDNESKLTITTIGSGDCLSAKAEIYLKKVDADLTSSGNLIKADNNWEEEKITPRGTVYIENATINGNAFGDGIRAADKLFISGGNIAISTSNQNFWSQETSSKGLCAGNELLDESFILIAGGNIKLYTKDDAISCVGKINIKGSPAILIDSPDKYRTGSGNELGGATAITSTDIINIGESGNPVIRICNAKKGIESEDNINIKNGDIKINSWDNGLDGNGNNSNININGGTVYVYSEGNGLICSGDLNVTGGCLVVNQANSQDKAALSFANTFRYSGGTLIGAGSLTQNSTKENMGRKNFLQIQTNSLPKGNLLYIKEVSGNTNKPIIAFIPAQASSLIEFASEEIISGATYNVYVGGSITSNSVSNGIFADGTYTEGKLLGSATITSLTTEIVPSNN